MFKQMMLKAMLAKQLKGMPKEAQDKMISAVTKNPQLFADIAESAKKKMAAGKSQMDATMEAVRERQAELQKLLGQ